MVPLHPQNWTSGSGSSGTPGQCRSWLPQLLCLVLASVMLIGTGPFTPAWSQLDHRSAAFHHQACKGLLSRGNQELHLQGSCAGQISALVQLSDVLPAPLRFCMPAGATLREAAEAVTSYMDRHPTELHLALPVIALLALRETWPCSSGDEAVVLYDVEAPRDELDSFAEAVEATTSFAASVTTATVMSRPTVTTLGWQHRWVNSRKTL